MQNNFDWNDLKYFLELSRRKKMVDAAKRLKVDQTTVSRRINALEIAIGAKLFVKNESGYRLTQSGESLIELAFQVENSIAQVADSIGGETSRLSGTVRVGAPDGIGTFYIAPRLSRFQESHPDLNLDLIVLPRYFNLSQHEAHLSISLARPTTGRLLARKMTDYHLHFYASTSYLEKYGEPQNLHQLKTHKLIGYIDDLLYAPELKYLDDISKNLPISFRSSSIIAQRQAIMAGTGIGILPRFFVKDDPRLIPILLKEYQITRSLWLLSHEDTLNLMRVRAVSDFLQNEAKNESDLFLSS